jgi:predicted DNA-binding antitoxin AbrB/MazE fold protein
MTISIRAVFENGRLRPLEPVDLIEGQEIELMILTEDERAVAALRDLLVEIPAENDISQEDEDALMREVEEAFRDQRPLSESIIEERREGP